MKKAAELITLFFDDKTRDAAEQYSALFNSWASIVKAQKIPAAVDHSRVVEYERQILLIEADHPGWIQIFQTKQRELLSAFQRRFPEITGISFRLSRKPMQESPVAPQPTQETSVSVEDPVAYPPLSESPQERRLYTAFDDSGLAETLRHLKQGIMVRSSIK
ncbi:MAG: DUF721 domain-containing protein [Treponema sp.]|jgi:hypothetical protein|nr:DUF721 domain-containing protein [Treponema sp.]